MNKPLAMDGEFAKSSHFGFFRRIFPPSFVLLLSLTATLWGWHFTSTQVVESARLHFEREVERIEQAIQDRLRLYENSLYGAQGLFAGRGMVSREEWRRYVEKLNLQMRYPGIQGIGFSLRVPPGEKLAHIQKIRSEGFPDYTIRPEEERNEYHSIIYLEPFKDRNLRAFGYDMFSEPVRRAAMERARDTGLPAVSGKVRLVQETAKDIQAGFLMYLPVYQNGQPRDTVEERRAALLGFVYSPFRMNDLMEGVLGRQRSTIDFKIFDGRETTPASLMYDNESSSGTSDQEHRPPFVDSKTIEIGGYPWTLLFATLPSFDATIDRHEPAVVLSAGLAISLLLFGITWSFANSRARAVALARGMTEELRESREQFRAVAETANDAIVSAGEQGTIIYFNRAAERMFGYSAKEAFGQSLTLLMPERFHKAHRAGFERFLSTGQSRIIGKTLELVARDKNGMEFPMEISVANWTTTKGMFFTAILRDITARKEAEEALRKINEELELRVKERTAELTKAVESLEQAHQFRNRVMESAVFGLGALDENGKFTLVNQHLAEIVGYSVEELMGKPYSLLLSADNKAMLAPCFYSVLHEKQALSNYEIDVIKKDRAKTTVVFSWSPMLVKDKVVGVVVTMLDVSARKQAEEKVRMLNAELEKRVTERTAQLETSIKELEAFSYSVSHDLRAPLRHIHSFVEILREECASELNEAGQRYLVIISKSVKQMGKLIDDLLAFSRMGRVEMHQTLVSMDDLINEVLREMAGDIQGRNIEWEIHPLPKIRGDHSMLKQVWVNLLSNAVKFTRLRNPAKIRVGYNERDEEVEFYVQDNGAGFDMRYSNKLFGVFQRLHHAEEFEGTGVGLANVHRIISRHSGQTRAEGKANEGATFYFTLPNPRQE